MKKIAFLVVLALLVGSVVACGEGGGATSTPSKDTTMAPAQFNVSNLSVTPSEVEVGDEVTVTVEVTNVGGQPGSYQLSLTVDGQAAETNITLGAGETRQFSFTVVMEEAGTRQVAVNGLTTSLSVRVGEREPTVVAPRLGNPITLDGAISGNEWDDAGQLSVTFVYSRGGVSLTYPGTIYLKHDGTYLWICIRVQDEENKYPEMYDYAAILFDTNGNHEIGSGDDSAIIHHGLGPVDLRPGEDGVWRSDTEFGGNSDVAGQSGWAAGWYTYEMRKPLNSGDRTGCDIAISPGDTILATSCVWDAAETTESSADAGSFYIEVELLK